MKDKLFFDMDGTICDSRQVISPVMAALLYKLQDTKEIIVISGAEKKRILLQLGTFKPDYILAQSGADSPFWKQKITEREETEVLRHTNQIKKAFQEAPWKGEDFYQNRGCQISFSLVGHSAPMDLKTPFDPTGGKRALLLKRVPFFSTSLKATIAGTTCIDYTHREYTKGKNVERLIKQLKWDKKDCVYFGDKLFKGGNDETVVGVIETVQVSGPEELFKKLKKYA